MKKRTKRILKAIFIPIACITIFFLLNFLLNAAAEPRDHVSPDYAKTCLKNSRFGVEKFNFSLGEGYSFIALRLGRKRSKARNQ